MSTAADRAGSARVSAKREREASSWGRAAAALLCIALVLGLAADLAAAQGADPGTVVQTIDASLWMPPAPDTAGITYRPDTGELLTCDSEVEETVLFAGVNLWTHARTGAVTSTASTTAYSNEPTGIVWDPAGGRLFVADDVQRRVFEVDFGPDGVWNTADDAVFSLRNYHTEGCEDLEDIAYNPLTGVLYVSGGGSREICTIGPGPNGFFDGAPPSGDDVVSTFSVAPYGINDPEGIAYDPFWDTLVLADRSTRDLYEVTPGGVYLRRIDVDFPRGTKPSGVTIAPGSTNPLLRSYWVTDRRVDNNADPAENDGRIYEVVALPLGGNGAPVVDAGPDRAVTLPETSVELAGFVSDDGHPYPPSVVASLWSQLSGPGSVTFDRASSPSTTATFSEPGSYVLQLEGDDSLAQSVDTVTVVLGTTVTLGTASVGPGALAVSPLGGAYVYGQTVTLSATPEPGAAFVGWGGDLSGAASPQPLLMSGDKLVTATFAALHDVTLDVTGPGSVTLSPPGGTYPAGRVVTLTATPGPNAAFDGWSGDLAGAASPQLLTVDGDKTIGASFTQLAYTLSASTVGGGFLIVDPPSGPYPASSTVSIGAGNLEGWVFQGWSGDATGSANPLLLAMDADKSVVAHFVQVAAPSGGLACGVGPELAAAVPLLAALRRRRRARPR